jgi:hypothetical protein
MTIIIIVCQNRKWNNKEPKIAEKYYCYESSSSSIELMIDCYLKVCVLVDYFWKVVKHVRMELVQLVMSHWVGWREIVYFVFYERGDVSQCIVLVKIDCEYFGFFSFFGFDALFL